MRAKIFTNPVTTLVAGFALGAGGLALLLQSCAARDDGATDVSRYRAALDKSPAGGIAAGTPAETAALARFTSFLKGIGEVSYVRENTRKVYAADAYLDDTLSVHHGATDIESYFAKTSARMKSYQVSIDDTARSGDNYYVRWTMIFAADGFEGGNPVHSIGVSQIRFNSDGRVTFHQDFWDAGKNFYGHLPVVGGGIGFVRKRLQSN